MNSLEIENKVREIIRPLLEMEQVHLVDLEVRGKSGSRVVNIYADTDLGITLAEITRLTREINDLLDMHDVIPGFYRLNVSSPGVDRPLRELWEFRKNLGRELRVIFRENEQEKELTGKLLAAEEEQILLQVNDEELRIPIASLIKARVQLKW
ncbi:MAG: ribosome maturation factor RimP [Calditrichaceae bacterium]|nr:ribosome maturation factor RimP [Calditrichia bacterium]NUQ43265.1 ribosome maturation factor RimP [Calditrichaceae bacterium]